MSTRTINGVDWSTGGWYPESTKSPWRLPVHGGFGPVFGGVYPSGGDSYEIYVLCNGRSSRRIDFQAASLEEALSKAADILRSEATLALLGT